MPLKENIVRDKTFEKYHQILRSEVNLGFFKYEIFWAFEKDRYSNSKAFRYAGVFYAVISGAFLESVTWHLARIIDYHKDSINIGKFLGYLNSKCSRIFPREVVKTIQGYIRNDRIQLDKLREKISNIKKYRDTYLAHIDKKKGCNQNLATNNYPLTYKEIKSIFQIVSDILNHYSGEYDNVYNVIGGVDNDYDNFKRCIEKGYDAIMTEE